MSAWSTAEAVELDVPNGSRLSFRTDCGEDLGEGVIDSLGSRIVEGSLVVVRECWDADGEGDPRLGGI